MPTQITQRQLRDFRTLTAAGLPFLMAVDVLETEREAIELAQMELELRDSHGRWIKGGSTPRAAMASQAARAQGAAQLQSLIAITAMQAPVLKEVRAEEAAREAHASDVAKKLAAIEMDKQKLERLAAEKEARKARIKLAVHIGTIVAAAILVALATTFGAPLLLGLGASFGPLVIMELTDAAKKL
jgi:hypothetical protein